MKRLRTFLIGFILVTYCVDGFSQESIKEDTITNAKALDSVTVIGYMKENITKALPGVNGTYLFSGKKSESINMADIPADIANKTARQVFAKVPGVFVYDMDGAGNQVNIASRGLDPHRGWEFNIRKDGMITNSDMYGYPASHYSMPFESIDRIELVRGTGSLQYGAQFGGMLNYVSKQGDTTRAFGFESVNSIGSFNLLSTYNAVGGKIGKFKYYAYMSRKSRDGYRDVEHTNSDAESVAITYEPSAKFSVKLEWSRSAYTYRIPGPMTDSMFYADPTQATRTRNYFNPDIHIPSVNINWQVSPFTKLQLTSSAVLGDRNSVQYDKPTNVPDTINPVTMQYNNRQVDIDQFHSYTTELRLMQDYHLFNQLHTLVAGVQHMHNDLHRRQLGKGTTGSDFDLTLVDPVWGRDLHFKTQNIAFFLENKFQLAKNFSVNMGARVEDGQSKMSGTMVYYPENKIPLTIHHQYPLLGAGFSYKTGQNNELYGGFSQAYRSMAFKDLIPGSLYERTDPNIKDAKGYNVELGVRGNWKFIRWDINGFLLRYNNRFGTLSETDDQGAFYTYRTNIGNSLTKGIEFLLQGNWLLANKVGLSVFTSTALMDARYTEGMVKSGTKNVDIKDNKVESAPGVITRNGVTLRYRKFNVSALYSYTSKTYADALNTVEPPKATGAVGIVPAYALLDANIGYRFNKHLEVRASLNNLTDKQYFTKRPSFYPGPGVWPSEGRNGSITFKITL